MSAQFDYDAHARQRWAGEPEQDGDASPDRGHFARDRARVIHSAALRRLAAKTQVVQPHSDDFVRNRLTHTLEVAQIGRELASSLGADPDVVDAACLAHDLGHPPFGHNGEQALAEIARDIGGFEGNAQTLRLLTRLEAKRSHPDGRPAGLNLTRATLDAATKYPWARNEGPVATPKFGVYQDDLPVFDWLRSGAPARHPSLEAQVMDWADDVAYSVHDVEDAIVLNRLDPRVFGSRTEMAGVVAKARQLYAPDSSEDELYAALDRLVALDCIPPAPDGSRAGLARLKAMTSRLVGRFVASVRAATRTRHGDRPLGRHGADLVVPRAVRAECVLLKAASAHYVMYVEERLDAMARQRDVVQELAAALLDRPADRLDPAYQADHDLAQDDGARLRVVVDQVASWTDLRATALHARWCR